VALQKCQSDKSRCSWRGKSHEIVKGEVAITSKRSMGQLVPQKGKLTMGNDIGILDPPEVSFDAALHLQLI
jgi:hypothetical protein